MNRYFSLCVFLIIFVLLQSIEAAPKKGEGSSSGEGSSGLVSLSSVKNLANKVGKEVSALSVKLGLKRARWENVVFSHVGDEEGVLKAEVSGRNPVYCFYPNSTLIDGHTKNVDTDYCFKQQLMVKTTRDGRVVRFELGDNCEYVLTFANDGDASQFIGDKPK